MKKAIIFLLCSFLTVILITSCDDSTNHNSKNDKPKQHLSEEAKEYLAYHSTFLNIFDNEDFTTFSMIDPYLEGNDIFFSGEQHATKKNFDIKLKFLKYFNQKKGMRYYLEETGYGSASLINRYLVTGEEDITRKCMNALMGTAAYLIETFEFWRKVRDYNLSLPEDLRTIFVGADVDHQVDLAIFALYLLLPEDANSEPPYIDEIRNLYVEFNSKNFTRIYYRSDWYDEVKSLITNLSQALETNENLYREYLADNMFDFKMIVDNCIKAFSFYEEDKDKIREEAMYDNFLKFYNYLPESIPKRFYGQWGGFHIYQQSSENNKYGTKCFATMLNNGDESPVKGKVISIYTFYHNSYYLNNKDGKVYPITYENNYSKELAELAVGDVTLFKLIGENSPFEKECFLINSDIKVGGYATTDYFQFAILISNSDAATRWE